MISELYVNQPRQTARCTWTSTGIERVVPNWLARIIGDKSKAYEPMNTDKPWSDSCRNQEKWYDTASQEERIECELAIRECDMWPYWESGEVEPHFDLLFFMWMYAHRDKEIQ